MRASLSRLTDKERSFVLAHTRYEVETEWPTDEGLAKLLGVTRKTIINRRKSLREKGVELLPFNPRGFQIATHTNQLPLFN